MSGARVSYAVADAVAAIGLDRPPVNALDEALLDGLLAALARAAADDTVRVVLLTSAVPGRFCAGLDLALLAGHPDAARPLVEKLYLGLAEAQHALGKPSIAAVNGTARGGGMTLAISCDVIVAAESASFGYPEIDRGLAPAIHFFHLPRIVGRHRAFELLLSGRSFGAAEAASLGLVSRVVPDAKLHDAARALARDFAAKPPQAMRLARAAFLAANDYRASIREAVELFCRSAATDDARAGLRAFAAKQTPRR